MRLEFGRGNAYAMEEKPANGGKHPQLGLGAGVEVLRIAMTKRRIMETTSSSSERGGN